MTCWPWGHRHLHNCISLRMPSTPMPFLQIIATSTVSGMVTLSKCMLLNISASSNSWFTSILQGDGSGIQRLSIITLALLFSTAFLCFVRCSSVLWLHPSGYYGYCPPNNHEPASCFFLFFFAGACSVCNIISTGPLRRWALKESSTASLCHSIFFACVRAKPKYFSVCNVINNRRTIWDLSKWNFPFISWCSLEVLTGRFCKVSLHLHQLGVISGRPLICSKGQANHWFSCVTTWY